MPVTGGSGRRQAAEIRVSARAAPGSVTIARSASEERARQQPGLRAGRPSAIAGLGRKALAGLDIPSLLEEAVQVVASTLEVPYAKILELLPHGDALLLRAGVGWRDGYVGRATVGAGAESQAGFTLLSDKTIVVGDLRTETRFQASALLLEHGVVSGMSTIIRGRDRPFGVLGAHDTRRRSFSQDDVDFLRAVASIVGIAIERGRADEALRQSEERLRAHFKAIPVPTFSWQRVGEDFVLIDYNDAAELITEGHVAALVGNKTARELYGDMPEILEDLERCFRDRKPVEREMLYRFRSRDGTAQFAVTYAFVPPDIVMVHAKDVTEETQAKDALRRSEERFRALIENSSDMVALVGTDGIVTYASPSVRRILGFTTDDSIGHRLEEIVHPDDYQRISQEFAERLGSPGSTVEFELRIRHSDGSWRWIEAVANNLIAEPGIRGVVLNCRDITQRKQAEEAVRESEARYRSLTEQASDGIFVADMEGRCLEANSRACEMLGYTREELLKLTYKDVFVPEALGASPVRFDELRGGRIIRTERKFTRKDGTSIFTEISARLLEDGRVLAIVRDVSERTQTEVERDALLLQKEGLAHRLFQVQEEERRRVAYDIHDGPTQQLVAAGMYLEGYRMKRAQRAPEAEAYLQRAAGHLSSAARECRRIISALRPSALDDFGLAAALKLYAKEVTGRCGCPVTFRANQSGVRHDAETETVLFRIAQEAMSNAVKHSGTDRLGVRLRETASRLILEVRDWGCGFEVAKAWKSKEGHRMGLVSMRERAELLGGALRIDSAPGQGTTVRVELRRDHLDASSTNSGRETDVEGRRNATTNR